MKDAILDSVSKRHFATFQDLSEEVAGFWGEYGLFRPDWPAIVVWHAVSKEGIAAIGELMSAQQIFMHLAPAISYRADKEVPPLSRCRDLAKDGPGPEIKWLPVVFTTSPKFDRG